MAARRVDVEAIYDHAVEQAVLGALLAGGETASRLFSTLRECDFFAPTHRMIFAAARDAHSDRGAADVLATKHLLVSRDQLDKIGGIPYLLELADAMGPPANAEHHAQLVKELAEKRRLHAKLTELADACRNGTSSLDIQKELSLLASETTGESGWVARLGDPVPWTEIPETESVEWICESLLARKLTTLFVGLWKAGKTTYLAALLHHLGRGGTFAGWKLRKSKCLLITEEALLHWRGRAAEFEASENVHIWSQPFQGRASWSMWESFLSDVTLYTQSHGYDVVIFDSMPNLWPVEDENDAGEMGRAIAPMTGLANAGCAVLVVHHPRKSGGGQGLGISSRGSGQFPGVVDVIAEMCRFDNTDMSDRRRIISIAGRFGLSERVIEWRGGSHFAYIGDPQGARANETLETALSIFTRTQKPLSVRDVLDLWPGDQPPSKRTIERTLSGAVGEGLLTLERERTRGRGAAPALYALPAQNDDYDPFAFDDEELQKGLFE